VTLLVIVGELGNAPRLLSVSTLDELLAFSRDRQRSTWDYKSWNKSPQSRGEIFTGPPSSHHFTHNACCCPLFAV